MTTTNNNGEKYIIENDTVFGNNNSIFWKTQLQEKNSVEADKFKIIKTASDGDCFFDTVRKAFFSIGKKDVTVEKLRGEFNTYIEKNKETNSVLYDNYKNFLSNNKEWADDTVIGFLEDFFNFKMIILKEEKSNDNDKLILNCNVDTQTRNYNKDLKYILTTYSGNHYRLVGYYDSNQSPKYIFTFDEIPEIIKESIVKDCIESVSNLIEGITPFYNIPEFKQLFDSRDSLSRNLSSDEEKTNVDNSDEEMEKIIAVAIAALQKEQEEPILQQEAEEDNMEKIIAVAVAALENEEQQPQIAIFNEDEDQEEEEEEEETQIATFNEKEEDGERKLTPNHKKEEEEEDEDEDEDKEHNIIIQEDSEENTTKIAYDTNPDDPDGKPTKTDLQNKQKEKEKEKEDEGEDEEEE